MPQKHSAGRSSSGGVPAKGDHALGRTSGRGLPGAPSRSRVLTDGGGVARRFLQPAAYRPGGGALTVTVEGRRHPPFGGSCPGPQTWIPPPPIVGVPVVMTRTLLGIGRESRLVRSCSPVTVLKMASCATKGQSGPGRSCLVDGRPEHVPLVVGEIHRSPIPRAEAADARPGARRGTCASVRARHRGVGQVCDGVGPSMGADGVLRGSVRIFGCAQLVVGGAKDVSEGAAGHGDVGCLQPVEDGVGGVGIDRLDDRGP